MWVVVQRMRQLNMLYVKICSAAATVGTACNRALQFVSPVDWYCSPASTPGSQ
jgi:hypothetical protein